MQKTNPSLFFVDGEVAGGAGLKGSLCGACGHTVLLDMAACPKCASRDLKLVSIGQRAHLGHSAEVFHSADGFEAPYFIGQIETTEGPRTFAPIAAAPGTPLPVGLPLRFTLIERPDGRTGFAYTPEKDSA